MKIVKSFYDDQYYNQLCRRLDLPLDDQGWEWGLGEDCELYCFCETFYETMTWRKFTEVARKEKFPLTIDAMDRIVKEFKDLLVFL